jgi:hypothetical protein
VSTIDPVARERDPAYAARRRSRWWTLLLSVAVVAGYGDSIFGDFPGSSFRLSLTEVGPVLKTALGVGGLIATMLILAVVVRLPRTGGLAGRQLFVVAMTLLAFTAGFFIGTFLPTVIPQYADADLSAARRSLRIACAALVLAVAAMVGLAVQSARRVARQADLRRTGRRVSATVTEVHDTGVTSNNAPWIRLTVTFTDGKGTVRYVRRHLYVSRLSRPSAGDRVPLYYDPADPGNVRKIVLGDASAGAE